MRNIVIAMFVIVLGGAVASGHIALAYNHKYTRDFSNSGNNQETQQDCGNSCTQTSSNTVNSGSSGLTSPSPSPSPTPTSLTVNAVFGNPTRIFGFLHDRNSSVPIAGATISFSGGPAGAEGAVNTDPDTVVTGPDGSYFADTGDLKEGDTITAQYDGGSTLAASSTNTVMPPP